MLEPWILTVKRATNSLFLKPVWVRFSLTCTWKRTDWNTITAFRGFTVSKGRQARRQTVMTGGGSSFTIYTRAERAPRAVCGLWGGALSPQQRSRLTRENQGRWEQLEHLCPHSSVSPVTSRLLLLSTFYLFYSLLLDKTDLIFIHSSLHPLTHPSLTRFTTYSRNKVKSIQSVLGSLRSFMQLCLGSKFNTKHLVQSSQLSVPWNWQKVSWERIRQGQAWGRELRRKVASTGTQPLLRIRLPWWQEQPAASCRNKK